MATIKVSQATLEEWAAVLSAVKDSATPALAERLAQMITALGQLAQRATEPAALETVDLLVTRQQTLQTVLDQLEQWRQDGTWTALTEFTALLAGIKNSASAPLAERLGTLAAQLGDLVGSATDPAAQALLTHALDHEPALSATVRQLAEWHHDGTWTAITEFAALLAGIKNSASAPLAERLGTLAAQLGPVVTRLTDAETLSTLDPERSPVFGNYNMFTVVGPEFFASNECRDRGDRPRRVAEPRGRPPVGAGLTKATQVIPEMRVLGNNALDS